MSGFFFTWFLGSCSYRPRCGESFLVCLRAVSSWERLNRQSARGFTRARCRWWLSLPQGGANPRPIPSPSKKGKSERGKGKKPFQFEGGTEKRDGQGREERKRTPTGSGYHAAAPVDGKSLDQRGASEQSRPAADTPPDVSVSREKSPRHRPTGGGPVSPETSVNCSFAMTRVFLLVE